MTDRELLEAAAAAIGRRIIGWNEQHGGVPVAVLDDGKFWQPLHDNHVTDCMGDALRLAVALRLNLNFEEWDGAEYACALPHKSHQGQDEVIGDDENEPTRRAIVRAAAALGEPK